MRRVETEITHDEASDTFYLACPHCKLLCQIPRSEIRCTIFRHGNFKDNMEFVPPHAPKDICDFWVSNDLIYGCGKPFKFDGKSVYLCGYI